MRTIRTKVYLFSELSEAAKQKAISDNYDTNVDHDWWENVCGDAEGSAGLKITGFDTGRGSSISGELIEGLNHSTDLILKNHGETCDTYKLAKDFQEQWSDLVTKYSDGIDTDRVSEDNEYDFDSEADELEKEYEKALLEEYLSLLRKEEEYLTSDEAIAETLEANEYEFLEDGKRF